MKHIIFDFDGVIGDTYQATVSACQQVFQIDKGQAESLINSLMLSKNGVELFKLFDPNLLKSLLPILSQSIEKSGLVFQPFIDQLARMKQACNYKLAINTTNLNSAVENLLGEDVGIFTDIMGVDIERSKIKKFQIQSQIWNVELHDIIFVTDSVNDLGDALEAGFLLNNIYGTDWGYLGGELLIKNGFLAENIWYNFSDISTILPPAVNSTGVPPA